MLRMPRGARDADRFRVDSMLPYLESIGCDGRTGRRSPTLLEQRGYARIAVGYIIVDTLRVPRATFAGILKAWRDGHVEPLSAGSGRDPADVRADFDATIDAIATAPQYGLARTGSLGPAPRSDVVRQPMRNHAGDLDSIHPTRKHRG